jgi:hypothetical protein
VLTSATFVILSSSVVMRAKTSALFRQVHHLQKIIPISY